MDKGERVRHSVIVMRAPNVDSLVRVPSPMIATMQKAVWTDLDDMVQVQEVATSLWHQLRRSKFSSPRQVIELYEQHNALDRLMLVDTDALEQESST